MQLTYDCQTHAYENIHIKSYSWYNIIGLNWKPQTCTTLFNLRSLIISYFFSNAPLGCLTSALSWLSVKVNEDPWQAVRPCPQHSVWGPRQRSGDYNWLSAANWSSLPYYFLQEVFLGIGLGSKFGKETEDTDKWNWCSLWYCYNCYV